MITENRIQKKTGTILKGQLSSEVSIFISSHINSGAVILLHEHGFSALAFDGELRKYARESNTKGIALHA